MCTETADSQLPQVHEIRLPYASSCVDVSDRDVVAVGMGSRVIVRFRDTYSLKGFSFSLLPTVLPKSVPHSADRAVPYASSSWLGRARRALRAV